MSDRIQLAIENERLKSGLYCRVVARGVEHTACRGCLYPEGSWPGAAKHGKDCWVEGLLISTPTNVGARAVELAHEMARRLADLSVRRHEQLGHEGPSAACAQIVCALDRKLLEDWHALTGESLRAGRAWGSRIDEACDG
jgi:hypothetical protein